MDARYPGDSNYRFAQILCFNAETYFRGASPCTRKYRARRSRFAVRAPQARASEPRAAVPDARFASPRRFPLEWCPSAHGARAAATGAAARHGMKLASHGWRAPRARVPTTSKHPPACAAPSTRTERPHPPPAVSFHRNRGSTVAKLDHRNQSRYWHSPGISGVDLLLADFTTHDYAPHVHDSLVVAVTEVGGSVFKSRGQTRLAEPNAVLVFNPCEPHSGRMGGSSRWRYRSFYLAEAGLSRVLTLLGMAQPRFFTSNVLDDPQLVEQFLTLHRAMDEQDDLLRQQELLVSSFGTLFSRHGLQAGLGAGPGFGTKAGLPALKPALDLMNDCFDHALTLEQIAAAAGLTSFQLITAFNRVIGLTPHAYLNQLRLRAALRELQAGRSLADAALTSGFYDQSALCNHFKRTFGMTPMQYTRALAPGKRALAPIGI
ncbi:AraC family transcriptional regulator [Burkholderia pseudomallei]|nr:AraC family transcriptional regulator [Burkholderia pseudomallei]MBO2974020.1 AraC family transcriptional regulator [Burkholderia pseudomallei]MBO3059069.1 AraC family transcriptional regulator [Burkholderia pseudomallei]MBO7759483.1 AraC family transcriptional regulator [Burkholderia pseudomallei]MBO7824339.1 AraC family transcriptional regulator [Burkholderia pseudomallei]QTB45796.1 AraC family transcriptional regulator [Burkholderia pseudomallei]